MKIFSQLFGFNKKNNYNGLAIADGAYNSLIAEQAEPTNDALLVEESSKSESKDQDKVEPTVTDQPLPTAAQPAAMHEPKRSTLMGIVNKDHGQFGYDDGRYRHSNQLRLEKESQIIIEIDLEIEKLVERLESKIHMTRIHKTEIDPHFMPEAIAQFDEQLAGMQEELLSLKNHQELVKQGNGLAQKPLNNYRIAYRKGYQDFMDFNNLLGRHDIF